MPRSRLPWYKVWVGTSRHSKIVPLTDRSFRVWHELLDAASEQKTRGRFESVKAAALIVRRKPSEVQALVDAGLIDVTEDGIWMHDWKDWQRWRPEDAQANDSDSPPEDHANGNGITHESLTNNTGKPKIKPTKNHVLARAREDGEGDVEGEEDREKERDVDVEGGTLADAPPSAPPGEDGKIRQIPVRGNPKVQAMIDAFAKLGIDPVMAGRDYAEIKRSNADPELVAEVYDAVARRLYGDDFMRRRLSVHEAIEWVNGYVEDRAEREARALG